MFLFGSSFLGPPFLNGGLYANFKDVGLNFKDVGLYFKGGSMHLVAFGEELLKVVIYTLRNVLIGSMGTLCNQYLVQSLNRISRVR